MPGSTCRRTRSRSSSRSAPDRAEWRGAEQCHSAPPWPPTAGAPGAWRLRTWDELLTGQGAWGCGVAERPGQGLLRGLRRPGALTELNGPTEFQLSTHIKANLTRPPKHADARCPLGSLAIYDIRVMHRGGTHLRWKQAGSHLGRLARRVLFQRQIMPRAAPSSGQPRPIGRLGPHWPGQCRMCMGASLPTTGANRSDADRPVVYLTFSRIWYRDMLNP